jgi:hypothetical protein
MPLSDLVNKGYFPRELPPPFTTYSLANFVSANPLPAGFGYAHNRKGNRISKAAEHNLARAGSLRRRLSVPNPIGFLQCADTIYTNWARISASFTTVYSLSTPTLLLAGSDRAIAPAKPFSDIALRRIAIRAGARFGLRTDINSFYPSLYTHAIPWAVEGKAAAKRARKAATLGNILDCQTRNGQDSQTVGIPIGPDTSLVIAELVLSVVDSEIASKTKATGFRYLDDYEFAFRSYTEAERVLSTLQSVLSEFELALNPRKSQIFDLPALSEEPFAGDLRIFHFRGVSNQNGDLRAYFDKAFSYARAFPDGNAIKYAISRLGRLLIHPQNWPLYENLLLQAATAEPGCLPFVVAELYKYSSIGVLNRAKVGDILHYLITLHAPLEHGSEVVWALWGCKILSLPIPDVVVSVVEKMRDNFVALVALDLQQSGLISPAMLFPDWRRLMKAQELTSENWLLSYEANFKGWLPSLGGADFVATSADFGPLKAAGVYFYDETASGPGVPLNVAPYSAPSEAGEEEEQEEEEEEEDDVNPFGMSP